MVPVGQRRYKNIDIDFYRPAIDSGAFTAKVMGKAFIAPAWQDALKSAMQYIDSIGVNEMENMSTEKALENGLNKYGRKENAGPSGSTPRFKYKGATIYSKWSSSGQPGRFYVEGYSGYFDTEKEAMKYIDDLEGIEKAGDFLKTVKKNEDETKENAASDWATKMKEKGAPDTDKVQALKDFAKKIGVPEGEIDGAISYYIGKYVEFRKTNEDRGETEKALENGKEKYGRKENANFKLEQGTSGWLPGRIVTIKKEMYGDYNRNFHVMVEGYTIVEGILKNYDKNLKEGDSVKVKLYVSGNTVLVEQIKKA
jgi:hypothetical protein